MNRPGERDTAGRRWVPAPHKIGSPMTTGTIQGVWLLDGETVKWTYGHDGAVIGYTTTIRLDGDFTDQIYSDTRW